MRVRPDRGTFERSAESYALAPVWTELLADVSTPVGVFPALAGDGPGILLESVERSGTMGPVLVRCRRSRRDRGARPGGLRVLNATERLTVEVPNGGDARADLVALAESLRAPRVPDLPSLTGGLMGFLSYEAAGLLDGQPVPGRRHVRAPDRADARRPRRGVRPLAATAAPGRARRPRRLRRRRAEALEGLASRLSSPDAPSPDPLPGGAAEVAALGEPNMPDDRYREIVRTMKDHIRGRRHLPGCPRGVSVPEHRQAGSPIYRRLRVTNPAPYMFFVRMLGHGARRLVAGAARPCRGTDASRAARSPGHVLAARRSCATGSVRARAPRRPEGTALSTRCWSTSPATTWAVFAPRDRPSERAHVGRALLEGDAHREHRRGRARGGRAPARRPRGHVPGRHGDRRTQAPGDGADRRARADARAACTRGAVGYLHVRGRSRLLHHDPDGGRRRRARRTCRRVPGSSPTPTRDVELAETNAKAAALLPAIVDAEASGPVRNR